MSDFKIKWSFGLKIYTIALGILFLLIGLTSFTYYEIDHINEELMEISQSLVPSGKLISEINIGILEQEIHIERVFKLYKQEVISEDEIQNELMGFYNFSEFVSDSITEILTTVEDSLDRVDSIASAVEYSRIQIIIEIIEKEHNIYGEKIEDILISLENEDVNSALIKQKDLKYDEDRLSDEISSALEEFSIFIERRSQEIEQRELYLRNTTFIMVILAVIAGSIYALLMSSSIVKPFKRLINGTKELERGNLLIDVPVSTRDEIGEMTYHFNNMVRDIREKEHLKSTFGQFLDPRIVENLIGDNMDFMDNGERKLMTVFFSDVAGFSRISEFLTADVLVRLINNYLTLASEPIIRYNGVIDKYIGDAIIAFWGEPFSRSEISAVNACNAALEQFVNLEKLRKRLPEILGIRKGIPDFNIRIGLATGSVISGNIGSTNQQSYTIHGESVKIAESLEGLNKKLRTKILVCSNTMDQAEDFFIFRDMGLLLDTVLDKRVYELIDIKGECDPVFLELKITFEKALSLYEMDNLIKAKKEFNKALEIYPDDGPSLYYLDLINKRSNWGVKNEK